MKKEEGERREIESANDSAKWYTRHDMDLPQNTTTNISIPIVATLLATMPSPDPFLILAWTGVSSTYLFLKAMDPRADDFMKKVDKNFGGISEKLVKSTEFQQSLLITFDALIRTRGEEKREIIRNAYLNGFITATDKQNFELERIYRRSEEISLEAVVYLGFIKKDILPSYFAYINKENGLPSNVGREIKTPWNTSITPYISNWIASNYDITRAEIKKKYPNLLSDNKLYGRLKVEFPKKKQEYDERAAEFLSLGIFRSTGITVNGQSYCSFTSFGLNYLDFLGK